MSIKILLLRKCLVNQKHKIYNYQVIERGKVIASKRSSLDFAACLVNRNEEGFSLPYFHNSTDLPGEFDNRYINNTLYAIAVINGLHIDFQASS